MCSRCTFKTSGSAIQQAIKIIQAEVDDVNAMESGPARLEKCEQLCRKYQKVLHPQHFLQIALRQNLIEMYGHIVGYMLPELPDVILNHKIQLCREVLQALNIFHPGRTRSRALLMYELYAPIVFTARSQYKVGLLNGNELEAKLQEAIAMLEECSLILQWEDVTSAEFTIAGIAKQISENLKQSFVSIN